MACSALTELCMVTKTSMEKCSAHMKLADSAGKLKTIGFGDMLMLWDGNVMYVLFEAGSEAVSYTHLTLPTILRV